MSFKTWSAAALSLALAFGVTPHPAAAFPLSAPATLERPTAPVETVQYRHHHDRRFDRRHYGRHWHRPPPRHYRPWGPPVRAVSPLRSHIRWCAARYRSYDARSNTFVGFDGRRHRCTGPI